MNLDDRMKSYENITRNYLYPRMPIIVRIDGKCFHNYTKSFNKPFDDQLRNTFIEVSEYLMQNIQGCELAYTQSDEISLFIHTYNKFDTEMPFNGNIQKLVSIIASEVTVKFNKNIRIDVNEAIGWANFDCRCFNIPKEEVYNYFLWRMRDAYKNSIQSIARQAFGHSKCMNVNTDDLLFMIKGRDELKWDEISNFHKFGVLTYKNENNVLKNLSTKFSGNEKVKTLINNIVNKQEQE